MLIAYLFLIAGKQPRAVRAGSDASDFEAKLTAESFESLPLAAAQTRQVALLPWHHRDPFDRMLVAQAQVESLTLLTADDSIGAYGDFMRVVR